MQLYPFQVKGVEHLLSAPYGLPHSGLFDDPGTGKTPMSLAALKESNSQNGVILCPAVIKEQWLRQAQKWDAFYPDNTQVVYGTDAVISNRPFVILNYELVRVPEIHKQLMTRDWHCLIMDEAHRLKGHNSKQTHAVLHKDFGLANKCYWKWALSGTIMPNRPKELYPLLRSQMPQLLGEYDTWEAYVNRYCGGMYIDGKGATNVDELTARIQPYFLRRLLEEVKADCPPVIENEVWLSVDYESHPEWPTLEDATERRIVAEAKIPHIVSYIKQRLNDGVDKLVCFAFHRNVIEGVFAELQDFGIVKILGGISQKKREEALAKFTNDPSCRVFLAQIGSAGEGLDGLQEVCAELIQAEPDWTPGREEQAIRRLKRIGQLRPVIWTKLLAANSYEERIYWSAQRKRRVIDVVTASNDKEKYLMAIEDILQQHLVELKAIRAILEQQGNAPAAMPAPAAPPPLQLALPPATAPSAPAQAPSFAPPAPAAPVAPAAASGAVAAPATVAQPAATTATTTPQAADLMTRKAFEDQLIALASPHGEAGAAAMQALCAQFGVASIPDVHEAHFNDFLARVQAALPQAVPA